MTQWVRAYVVKPYDLSLLSGTHMVNRETPKSCHLTFPHVLWQLCLSPQMYTNKHILKI